MTAPALQNLLDDAWHIESHNITPLSGGNINETYAVDDRFILQWLNPIFGAAVNDDIASLVPILKQNAVPVPELIATKRGAWWTDGERVGTKKGIWRLMTKLPGKSLMAVENIDQIRALARMLGRFHKALLDSHYTFRHTRGFAHDFDKHWRAFDQAYETLKNHEVWPQVHLLREKIEHLKRFVHPDVTLQSETKRIIHGDPKCANFMFLQNDVCGVIDLDTMTRSSISCDVGDAIRSWCNAHNENDAPEFMPEYAREALGEYEETTPFLTKEERENLASAAPCIALELGIRFARDALCEDYFGFDPQIGHAKHSLLRAQNQVELAAQMLMSTNT